MILKRIETLRGLTNNVQDNGICYISKSVYFKCSYHIIAVNTREGLFFRWEEGHFEDCVFGIKLDKFL